MNSFAFIEKLKNIFSFSKASMIGTPTDTRFAEVEAIQKPVLASHEHARITTVAPASIIPEIPVAIPQTVNDIPNSLRPELPASDDNSLGNYGLKECAKSNGDVEILKSNLAIVAQNYIIEARLAEEDAKASYAQQMNEINYLIIDLNNQIANIQNQQIPEQENAIEEYERKMNEINNNTIQNNAVLPQTYTALELAVIRSKEGISQKKQEILKYKSAIDKEKYKMESLTKRLQDINLTNTSILNRRMNVFFNGWVSGLQGLDWNEKEIQKHKAIFKENDQHIMAQIESNHHIFLN